MPTLSTSWSPILVMTSHSFSGLPGASGSGAWTTIPIGFFWNPSLARRASFSKVWSWSCIIGLPS